METTRKNAVSGTDKQFRADFEIKVIKTDEASKVAHFEIRPDPRRYNEVLQDGERFYLDRYLGHLINLADMIGKMNELPMFTSPRSIDSAPDYADRRRSAVEHELITGEHVAPEEKARPHESFVTKSETRKIAFLSVDICGSTTNRLKNAEGFDTSYKIFLQELGTLVGQFHGFVLKTKGDGFIAYIDMPSFTTQCDSTVDLGLSFLVVLEKTVNPALKLAGLDPIKIRVGADYGLAKNQKFTVHATGFSQDDVVSDALNRAVKIEESCKPNQFRIGRELYELIHVQWLERAIEVPFDGATVGIENYKVYEVR